ncbi:MAG: glycerophosphodiester phosphodiesterase [Proteobacteria bacterium]|nr:glycerophosphodiester phosphodiesterase [Pseudomonadota bacterium]
MTRAIGCRLIGLAICGVFGAVPALAGGFDLQGHRGARGLAPENSLPAFAKALAIGVSTLELDVGITADHQVVVSHDLRLSPSLVRDAAGVWLRQPTPALYQLPLARLQRFDIGRIAPNSRQARRFPEQVGQDGVRVPTLAQVAALAERLGNHVVRFNIETKLRPDKADETPTVGRFVELLLAVIRQVGIADRTTIQSFDWRSLRLVQQLAPNIPTVYLTAQQSWLDNLQAGRPGASPWTAGLDIDAHDGSVPRLVKAAGGSVWSPYHRELDGQQLQEAHALGLKVIVWTVNDDGRMAELIDLGVDGIITDYPDRLRAVMAEKGLPLPTATAPPEAAK